MVLLSIVTSSTIEMILCCRFSLGLFTTQIIKTVLSKISFLLSTLLILVTKCQSLAKELNALGTVINGTTVLPPGTFVPKCNKDGAFEVVQCHPSTGYCWCVDEVGSEILHTKTRQGKPDCQRCKFCSCSTCSMIEGSYG